jgi:hypothetical protein
MLLIVLELFKTETEGNALYATEKSWGWELHHKTAEKSSI